MSQSLHAIPIPHFGCHFDGHMNAKPFAQQQENGGLNLNRKKSVAHVAGAAAEYDQKEDVKADIDSHNQHQLQEKGQGFETKKSSAPDGDAEHETDVKHLKDDFTNNTNNQAASDDIKPLDARPLQEVINERRISQGRKPITNEDYYREINHLEHCPTCRSFCVPAPRTTIDHLDTRLFRHQEKQERNRAKNSIPLNMRLLPRPEHPPPIDPQKFWENFDKNRRHMKRSA